MHRGFDEFSVKLMLTPPFCPVTLYSVAIQLLKPQGRRKKVIGVAKRHNMVNIGQESSLLTRKPQGCGSTHR